MTSLSQPMSDSPPTSTWATYVSDIFSPPIVWGVPVLLIAVKYSPTVTQALLWTFILCFLVCVLPVVYVVTMVRLGHISDLHMHRRQDRYIPLFLTMGASFLAWVLLKTWNAPGVFSLLALFGLAQITIIALVTLKWQISVHAMAITGAVMAVGLMLDLGAGLALVPLIVLVGAARIHLKRHTPAQVAAGSMVGLLVPVLLVLTLETTLLALL